MDNNTRIRLFSPSMARTNYTPTRQRRGILDLLLTAVVVALITYLLAHVGPAMDGAIQEIEAEQKVRADLERDARFAQAAQTKCGGDEATWIEVQPRIVDCFDKRGRRTARNVKVQP